MKLKLILLVVVAMLTSTFTLQGQESAKLDALSDPGSLPVVPICELFRNLAAYKGKRIAVRGEFVNTMESLLDRPTERTDNKTPVEDL